MINDEQLSEAYQILLEREIDSINNSAADPFNDGNTFIKKTELENIFSKETIEELFTKNLLIDYSNGNARTIHADFIYRLVNIRNLEFQRPIPLEFRINKSKEYVPDFGAKKLNDVIPQLLKTINLDEKLIEIILQTLKTQFKGLSSYQYPVIQNILTTKYRNFLLSAPTSSGKTLSFFLPVFVTAANRAFNKIDGVSSVIIYPRKALARDQFQKFLKIIDTLNEHLTKEEKSLVTIGIDDKDTQWQSNTKHGSSFRMFTCPKCDHGLIILVNQNSSQVTCSNCKKLFPYIFSTKDELRNKKPTILITNIWILYRRILSHTTIDMFKNLDHVVLDEAHIYSYFLGGHVSYILQILRFVSNINNKTKFIFSSATIPNPVQFIQNLARLDKRDLFYLDFDETLRNAGAKQNRMLLYLYLLPHPRRDITTLTQVVTLAATLWAHRNNMKAITFIDSVAEINTINSYIHNTILGTRQGQRGGGEVIDHVFGTQNDIVNDYYWGSLSPEQKIQNSNTFREFVVGDYKNSIEMHYGGLSLPRRANIEKLFLDPNGGVKSLLSTSTLELGIDLSDVGIIIQHKLPLSAEGVVQRIGRAGRNTQSFRIGFGIVLLPTSPMSSLYMFDNKLRNRLENITSLPGLEVGHSSENLRMQYLLSLLLLKRALENKPTWIELGPEGLRTDDDLILALNEILTDLDSLSSFNDIVRLLTKQEFNSKFDDFKKMLRTQIDGMTKLKGKNLSKESEKIQDVKARIDSINDSVFNIKQSFLELWFLIKDIEMPLELFTNSIKEAVENYTSVFNHLSEFVKVIKQAEERQDSRIIHDWQAKYLDNLAAKIAQLPSEDTMFEMVKNFTLSMPSNIKKFTKQTGVNPNKINQILSDIGTKIGTSDEGLLASLNNLPKTVKELESIDFSEVSSFSAIQRFRDQINESEYKKLEIFQALSAVFEGRAYFSLLLQTPSADFEMPGVDE